MPRADLLDTAIAASAPLMVEAGPLVRPAPARVLSSTAEPTSQVCLQVVRVDELDGAGHLVPGTPEVLITTTSAPVPMNIVDVDTLIAELRAVRAHLEPTSSPRHRGEQDRS